MNGSPYTEDEWRGKVADLTRENEALKREVRDAKDFIRGISRNINKFLKDTDEALKSR